MILGIVALVVCAWAGDPPADAAARLAVQRQEAVVDARAADVAALRAGGAGRRELGEAMGRYRDAAVELAALQGPLLAGAADAERAARAGSLRRLADAVANDRGDDEARAALVAWLGEPGGRAGVLDAVLAETRAAGDPVVRQALALDLAEQAAGLALVCRYDATRARQDADRARAQARSLRARTGPGQSGGLDLVVAAERAERDAEAAEAARRTGEALAERLEGLRAAALALSEGR